MGSLLNFSFLKPKKKSTDDSDISSEAKIASKALSAAKSREGKVPAKGATEKVKRKPYELQEALEAISHLDICLTLESGVIKVPPGFDGGLSIFASSSKENSLAVISVVESVVTAVRQYNLHMNRVREELKNWYASQSKTSAINIRVLLTDHSGQEALKNRFDLYDQERHTSVNSKKYDTDIDAMLIEAAEQNVSDMHMEIRKPVGKIRFRIHGELFVYKKLKYEEIKALSKVLFSTKAENQGSNFSPSQTGYKASADLKTIRNGESLTHRLRLQTIPNQQDTYDVITRRLPSGTETADLRLVNLGYLKSQLEMFERAMRNRKGVIMFAGETGSGKTTSCVACVQQFIRMNISQDGELRAKVITVEDPVEILVDGATQIPIVGTDGAENQEDSYSNALSWILRSDPDLVMISEVRNEAVAVNVVKGVQTGIPMISTVHASSALGIIPRCANIGMDIVDITQKGFFKLFCHQTLVQTVCKSCCFSYIEMDKFRETIHENQHNSFKDMLLSLKLFDIDTTDIKFRNNNGCDKCRSMGVAGRTPVAEIIEPTQEILQLCRNGQIVEAENLWYEDKRNYSMIDHALVNVELGLIDPFSFYNMYGNFVPRNWKPRKEARQ